MKILIKIHLTKSDTYFKLIIENNGTYCITVQYVLIKSLVKETVPSGTSATYHESISYALVKTFDIPRTSK